MVRTQVQFREQQYNRLRALAHRERISLSEAVRRLVDAGLAAGVAETDRQTHALLDIAGVAVSDIQDLGPNHDDYLDEDFAS